MRVCEPIWRCSFAIANFGQHVLFQSLDFRSRCSRTSLRVNSGDQTNALGTGKEKTKDRIYNIRGATASQTDAVSLTPSRQRHYRGLFANEGIDGLRDKEVNRKEVGQRHPSCKSLLVRVRIRRLKRNDPFISFAEITGIVNSRSEGKKELQVTEKTVKKFLKEDDLLDLNKHFSAGLEEFKAEGWSHLTDGRRRLLLERNPAIADGFFLASQPGGCLVFATMPMRSSHRNRTWAASAVWDLFSGSCRAVLHAMDDAASVSRLVRSADEGFRNIGKARVRCIVERIITGSLDDCLPKRSTKFATFVSQEGVKYFSVVERQPKGFAAEFEPSFRGLWERQDKRLRETTLNASLAAKLETLNQEPRELWPCFGRSPNSILEEWRNDPPARVVPPTLRPDVISDETLEAYPSMAPVEPIRKKST